MILPAYVQKIMELHSLAKDSVKKYGKKRFVYEDIKKLVGNKIFVGIAGLRGVGKTVLLRQLSNELPNSVYISMDSLDPAVDFFELAKELESVYGVEYLLIDEIHNLPNWQMQLKKIFDFLGVKIIFTSSAAIDIVRGKYDLSRRAVVVKMHPFSFREYLYFKKDILMDKVGLDVILLKPKEVYEKIYAYEPEFMEFCMRGALPAALETPYPQVMRNIIEKILTNDLMVFEKLDRMDIMNIENILRFVSRSKLEVCGYSSIAKNTGISVYKVREYLRLLEQTFLVRVVLPYGTNVLREPKILYSLPFRAYFAEGADTETLTGALREEFFVHHMTVANMDINYVKSVRGEKVPDYVVFYKGEKLVFEIGGAGKTGKQLKGLHVKQRYLLSQPCDVKTSLPLLSVGFLA